MKEKVWKIPYASSPIPPSLLQAGYSPLLSMVLSLRGITNPQQASELLSLSEDMLLDPLLITDMDKARDRVLRAVADGETVAVYGDYDVDGITSTCLLTEYLRSKGMSCIPYIPDRAEEGYGLNCSAIDSLKAQNVSLIVTVDCGITAVEEAQYAKSLGIDMVITDHHECRADALPEACALIDCKREDDTYPNKNLAGVGMALKLACACEGNSSEVIRRYCDLAAIGTVADVMPLIGENRYFVCRGIEAIKKHPRPGILAMLKEASVDRKKLTASSIGFSIAPRLNAAGRLGQASIAWKLLMSDSFEEAQKYAKTLCDLNRRRQNIETEIWQQANEQMKGQHPETPIVLASEEWHQGVIGIAASRLAEQYSLPAIMICLSGENGKGSCRSYGGFNLFEALSACSEYLVGFGGHALAAGLNIKRDMLSVFRNAIGEYYKTHKPAPVAEVQCDLLISDPSLLNVDNVRSLDLLEPYGNSNPKPLMCMTGLRLTSLESVGGGRHVRLRASLGKSHFECIYFSHSIDELDITAGDLIDLAFNPQINDFYGNCSVQLVVSAVRKHDPADLCAAILNDTNSVIAASARYCPERADFVRLWRSMGSEYRVGSEINEVLNQCLDNMEPERFCLCLMVLRETGLLRSSDGRIFSARPAQIQGKADLEGTELIRALHSAV